MSVRALIIDDEPLAIELMRLLADQIEGLAIVGTASDGELALAALRTHRPDLLLLDISMPEMSGMELARRLAALPDPPAVVFCTAFENFAVEAFDLAAVDYLLKPVGVAALCRAVERARERGAGAAPVAEQNFWVPHRGELIRITADEIDWIEAERDYARLHVGASSYLLLASMSDLERRLDGARFARLRRSVIIRRDFVAALAHMGSGVWTARLRSGEHVRIGRRYQHAMKMLREETL